MHDDKRREALLARPRAPLPDAGFSAVAVGWSLLSGPE
jgi:hypothetical protein